MTLQQEKSEDTLKPSQEEIMPGYARVSDVLRPFQDFSMIDPSVLERKGAIGTEVHTAIHAHFIGDLHPVSEDAREYLPAFKSFITSEKDLKPLCTEKRFYSKKLLITGKMDFVSKPSQGTTLPVLIDWKTSYTPNLKIWRLQLALYVMILSENKIYTDTAAKVIQLKKKGSYTIHELDLAPEDFALGRSAVKLYHYFNPSMRPSS